MEQENFEVLIVGAGATGLMAAWELVKAGKKVVVVEAKGRAGGRMNTIYDLNFENPVELGAEFIHGNLELTQMILKKAGLEYYEVSGEPWQKKEGHLKKQENFIEDYSDLSKKFNLLHQDISVAEFVDTYLQDPKYKDLKRSLMNYVEGYYAGDPEKVSTYALKDELMNSDDEQYRLEGGYEGMVNFLVDELINSGCKFHFSTPAKVLKWEKNNVTLEYEGGLINTKKLLVTVSIGVLRSGNLSFTPEIKHIQESANKLGFGPVIKTLLQFDQAFWNDKIYTDEKDLKKMGFLFSDAIIPTWWTMHPKNTAMLVGWSAGRHASILKECSDEDILQKALAALSYIFNIDVVHLQQNLKGWHIANWINDPYTCGGYSYDVVNGNEEKRKIGMPIENTIYFAGEGLYEGPEIGTVEAGLFMGRETAFKMITEFDD